MILSNSYSKYIGSVYLYDSLGIYCDIDVVRTNPIYLPQGKKLKGYMRSTGRKKNYSKFG